MHNVLPPLLVYKITLVVYFLAFTICSHVYFNIKKIKKKLVDLKKILKFAVPFNRKTLYARVVSRVWCKLMRCTIRS